MEFWCNQDIDPLEALVANGKLRIHSHCGLPKIVTVDLDQLAETLTTRLVAIFKYDWRLNSKNTSLDATTIAECTKKMVDYIVGQTYNKLKHTLERECPAMVSSHMDSKCPIPAKLVFPAWLSSTLSSIGPLRILDGAKRTRVIYATEASRSQYWGRKSPVTFDYIGYIRLITALENIGVRMAPFDFSKETGSFFPTLSIVKSSHWWDVYGQVHQSHYEKEDLARLALVASETGEIPFETVGMTVGYVDDEATLAALAALPVPQGVSAGETVDSAGVPVGMVYRVNYYGIQPADGGKPRGMYVIGRGVERAFQFVFASQVVAMGLNQLLKYRIMGTA